MNAKTIIEKLVPMQEEGEVAKSPGKVTYHSGKETGKKDAGVGKPTDGEQPQKAMKESKTASDSVESAVDKLLEAAPSED